MKIRPSHLESRPPSVKAADLLKQETAPVPLFSAKEFLESKAEVLRMDFKVIHLDSASEAVLLAKLAILFPEGRRRIIDKTPSPFPTVRPEVTRQGSNLFLLAQQFPETQNIMREEWSVEALRRQFNQWLDVWPLVLGRILYPAEDWSVSEDTEKLLIGKIERLVKDDPRNNDYSASQVAAHLVLIDPKLKPIIQPLCKGILSRFKSRSQRIMGTADAMVNMAFDLEIIFGDTIDGLNKDGHLNIKSQKLMSTPGLPERETL